MIPTIKNPNRLDLYSELYSRRYKMERNDCPMGADGVSKPSIPLDMKRVSLAGRRMPWQMIPNKFNMV